MHRNWVFPAGTHTCLPMLYNTNVTGKNEPAKMHSANQRASFCHKCLLPYNKYNIKNNRNFKYYLFH